MIIAAGAEDSQTVRIGQDIDGFPPFNSKGTNQFGYTVLHGNTQRLCRIGDDLLDISRHEGLEIYFGAPGPDSRINF